jgi:hypothetical protein
MSESVSAVSQSVHNSRLGLVNLRPRAGGFVVTAAQGGMRAVWQLSSGSV